jgi:hypothetical protein
MFDVRRPKQKPIVIIRAASGHELSNYEKHKLETIEDCAQRNVIESIKINGVVQHIDQLNKEVDIELGNLAFKSKISDSDIDNKELFFIKCELDEDF